MSMEQKRWRSQPLPWLAYETQGSAPRTILAAVTSPSSCPYPCSNALPASQLVSADDTHRQADICITLAASFILCGVPSDEASAYAALPLLVTWLLSFGIWISKVLVLLPSFHPCLGTGTCSQGSPQGMSMQLWL